MAMNIKPANRGLLHSKLGVPKSQPIPQAKLAAAKQSKSPALRKEATFAENAKGFQHPQSHDQFHKLGAPKGGKY